MSIAGQHVYSLYLITANLKIQYFIRIYPTLLNESLTRHNNKELPFRMMPMLPLGNPWLTYIHTKLTAIYRLQQFCETAALIFTAGTVAGVPDNLLSSGRTLSVHMYALWNEGLNTDPAYATGVVLLGIVILINMLSGLLAKKVSAR